MGAQASHYSTAHNANDSQAAFHGSPRSPQAVDQTPTSFTKRLSIRRSKKRRKHQRLDSPVAVSSTVTTGPPPCLKSTATGPASPASSGRTRGMDRLRVSLRDSFKRRKHQSSNEASRPQQWQADEKAVREGCCCFHVKYLGCVQVYESRGMQVCEDAVKLLRTQRRRSLRSILYVSGDGLRVVDDETKDMLVDQTIEKVSFCAPDRNFERGFSYICRDGTTRRWLCHGFMAVRESGERLSHAVGCAFAICLERKQQRDRECGVTMAVDPSTQTFTRFGSFRQATLTERLTDPQTCKPAEPVPVKPVRNPFAVDRPHAPPGLFERQGSLRIRTGSAAQAAASTASGGSAGGNSVGAVAASPFKRQYSLRLDQLPSNVLRQQRHLAAGTTNTTVSAIKRVDPIPEVTDNGESEESSNVTLLCKELTQGLNSLSSNSASISTASKDQGVATVPAPDQWLSSFTASNTVAGGGGGESRTASSCSVADSWSGGEAVSSCSPLPTSASTATAASAAVVDWSQLQPNSDPFSNCHLWSEIAERNNVSNRVVSKNPFLSSVAPVAATASSERAVKAFEVHM